MQPAADDDADLQAHQRVVSAANAPSAMPKGGVNSVFALGGSGPVEGLTVPEGDEAGEGKALKVGPEQRAALEFMRSRGTITVQDLSAHTRKDYKQCHGRLQVLVKHGLARKAGNLYSLSAKAAASDLPAAKPPGAWAESVKAIRSGRRTPRPAPAAPKAHKAPKLPIAASPVDLHIDILFNGEPHRLPIPKAQRLLGLMAEIGELLAAAE